jgi:hypothetical protein
MMNKMSNTPNKTTGTDDKQQVKLETLSQITEFINDGGGSFRKMIEYLDLNYEDAYNSGGMTISNAIASGGTEKNVSEWKNDPEQLINMLQTMILWIDNDYEDEELKGRAKEIHELLQRLETLLTTNEDHRLQIIKRWRDWHWHMHIHYEITGDSNGSNHHKSASRCYQQAYRIMIGNLKSAPTVMTGYEGVTYGDYPEEKINQ